MELGYFILWVAVSYFLDNIGKVSASNGDRCFFFHTCYRNCREERNCPLITDEYYMASQPFPQRYLHWTCEDECKYYCMWDTVEAFQKDGSPVPQFYGKWPFVRVYYIQEIASAIFSLLNLAAHVIMIINFRKKIHQSTPMYWIWHSYALVCVNAWVWSTVFHTRDTFFTERMDYYTAFSLVAYFAFTICARVIGTDQPRKLLMCLAVIILGYFSHIAYLQFVHFDYGYNMKVNITVGVINCLAWLAWCFSVRKKQPYVSKAVVMLLLFSCAAALEVLDFPPIWWLIDAHSLWHASTVPLTFVWYSFVIDDCLYLQNQKSQTDVDSDLKKEA